MVNKHLYKHYLPKHKPFPSCSKGRGEEGRKTVPQRRKSLLTHNSFAAYKKKHTV